MARGSSLGLGAALVAGAVGLLYKACEKEIGLGDTKETEAEKDTNSSRSRCKVAGNLYDHAKQPLAGIYILVGGDTAATKPDGSFAWEGPCGAIDRTRLRVSLGQGYCTVDVGSYLSSRSTTDQSLYVDSRTLGATGPGACPQTTR